MGWVPDYEPGNPEIPQFRLSDSNKNTSCMIRDARVLQAEFIPKEVVHRDQEINQLSKALNPVTDGNNADDTFLFGPSGAGKTCITKHAMEKLREVVLEFNHCYINCWGKTKFKILNELLEEINQAYDIHRNSTPTDELVDRIDSYDGPPYIAILDEVDQIKSEDVLYNLYRAPNISMVMIANREEEVFAALDSRLTSRLQNAVRVRFDSYHVDELVAILEDRVKWGLVQDSVSQTQLEWIADSAAGDARTAIGILREAAKEAEDENMETITDSIIEDAIPRGKTKIQKKNLNQLSDHQQVLYDLIEDRDGISPKRLYDLYESQMDDPVTKRTVRDYLRKMKDYNLIDVEGRGPARSYFSV